MDESRFSHLLDLIYGAATDPGLWIAAMEQVADVVGGSSAFLSQLDLATGRGTGLIARIDPLMPGVYLDHFADQNLLAKTANLAEYVDGWTTSILTDEDWIPKAKLLGSEYYNDFLRPQDIHSVLMVRLSLSPPTVSVLNLHRGRSAEQFGAPEHAIMSRLHPHLIRAFKLSETLSEARRFEQVADPLFENASNALFLVNRLGRVLRANAAGEALVRAGVGLVVVGGRLSSAVPAAARRLEALVAAATSPDWERRAGGSMPIPSLGRSLPLALTVCPLRPQRTSFLDSAAQTLVCVIDLEGKTDISARRLGDVFALTSAEARVVRRLLAGATPGQAAESLGVGVTTVRSQLASIFAKTGVSGQAELSRLVTRMAQVMAE